MPLLEDKSEEEIELLKNWAEVRQYIEKHFDNKPDIQTCLFLIGWNELGQTRDFTKEEKQDLMHIGMCAILQGEYYEFMEKDEDGWPHYKELQGLPTLFIKTQEELLKKKIVKYFQEKVFNAE